MDGYAIECFWSAEDDAFMRAARTWGEFRRNLDRAFPSPNKPQQIELSIDETPE